MNLKITEKSAIFKITEEELNVLANDQSIEKTVTIGCNAFAMGINPAPEEDFENPEDTPLKLILDRNEACLMLYTSKKQIQNLVNMGRSKEGISTHVDGLDVFLQVDLRADSRPRKKG